MRLLELSLVYETLLESKVDTIKSLLTSRLESTDLKVFKLIEVSLNESENSKGNYSLICRVVLEYPNGLIKDELDVYGKEVLADVKYLLTTLLSSENELFASRTSMIQLI